MFSVSRFDPGTAPVDEETTQLEATQQSERRTKRKRQQQQDDVAAAPTAADDDADHMMITDAATEQQAADAKAAKKAASRKSKKSKSATATEPVAAAEPQLSEAASVLPARAIKKLKSLDDSAARLALEQAEVEKQQRKAEKTALKRSKQQRRHEELAVEAAQRHAAQAEQQARLNAQAAKSEAIARAMQLKSMPVSVLPDVLNTTKPIAAAATTTLAPATATAGKRSVPPVTLNAIDSVAPLIHTPGMSLTAASIVSKGQKAKDPEERAHERKMRKRARLIKQAEDEGLPVPTFSDDDAEAEVETAPAPPQLDALSMIKQVTDATVAEIAASHSTRALPFHAAVAKMHAAAASAAATKPQLVVEGGEDNNAVADSTPTAAIPTAQSEAKLARQLALTAAQPLWMQHGTQIDNGQAPTPVEQLQLLDPMIRQTLTQSMQIHSLFPMQLAAMQTILRTHATNDVCCNFATGSGKTLAYVLPIIHSLSQRIVPRLRCLVIVPSRDLALQVQLVFKQFAQHSANQLRIGCAIGQHSFTQEQQDFVQLQLQQQQQSLDDASGMPRQYESLIDVLVSTPGRLMDHLQQTAGFTLIHLQWIVFDEIDRLLNQDYASWMSQVEQACKSSSTTTASWHQNASATSSSAASSSSLSAIQLRPAPCRVQKLLFSATLSTDPGKLAALHLHHPLLLAASLSASNPFTLPASLSQHLIACEPSEKPLVLLWLLARARLDTMKDMRKVIVFTASLESTHRLTRLLQLYFNQSDNDNSAAASIGKVSVHEFSSLISQHARTKLLNKFKTTPLADTNSNSCQVMVCSDAFSRGVDVPFVDYVFNYDIPSQLPTLVHRSGRTARAGRLGTAISLVKHAGKQSFYRLMARAQHSYVSEIKLDRTAQLAPMHQQYAECLSALRLCLADEVAGHQNRQQSMQVNYVKRVQAASQQQQIKQEEDEANAAVQVIAIADGEASKLGASTETQAQALKGEDAPVDETEWQFKVEASTVDQSASNSKKALKRSAHLALAQPPRELVSSNKAKSSKKAKR